MRGLKDKKEGSPIDKKGGVSEERKKERKKGMLKKERDAKERKKESLIQNRK